VSSDAASVSSFSGASIISIADMTPTNRYFVSLKRILLGIEKNILRLLLNNFKVGILSENLSMQELSFSEGRRRKATISW
jgi:hypothetical protein